MGSGFFVTIPAAIRPLPIAEPFCQLMNALIPYLQAQYAVQGIALLRRTGTVATLHDWNRISRIGIGLAFDDELVEKAWCQPRFKDFIDHWVECPVTLGVAYIRQSHQD